jgi:tetratricopeptide (TPR) repeat protein
LSTLYHISKNLNELFQAQRYIESLDCISKLPLNFAEHETVKFCKADCYYELRDFVRAEDIYKELSLSDDSERAIKAKYNRALCLRELKQYDIALLCLRDLDLNYQQTLSLLGELLYYTANGNSKVYEEAITMLDKWLSEKPSDGFSWQLLASCLNHLGHHDEALRALNKCLLSGHAAESVYRDIIVELDWMNRYDELEIFANTKLNDSIDPNGSLRKFAFEILNANK